MKIAVIAMTRDDDFRLGPWKEYYEDYKDELYRHVVVDNGSSSEYLDNLKEAFPDSTIVELGYNGGCTEAYNAGIKIALEDPEVDAIALIGNDVKIEKGGLTKLYTLLFSKPEYGMVGPVILRKDSDIIESFGCSLNQRTGLPTILYLNCKVTALKGKTMEVGYVAGGANISKRAFYEVDGVGLQDENLFMYGDERNMALRAARKGYKEVVTSDVLAWHQHIPNKKNACSHNPIVGFLIARNFVYTQKIFFNRRITFQVVAYRILVAVAVFLKHINNKNRRQYYYNFMKGIIAGLKGDMDNSFIRKSL